MSLIITSEVRESETFKIGFGKQITLLATGLEGTDKVVFEIVTLTSGGPAADVCCPGQVQLPAIDWAFPLTRNCGCDAPKAVELTATSPWIVLDTPQEFFLRAKVEAADDALVLVYKEETDSKLLQVN